MRTRGRSRRSERHTRALRRFRPLPRACGGETERGKPRALSKRLPPPRPPPQAGEGEEWSKPRSRLNLPRDHHLLDLGDRLGGVEALRAGLGAVHDGMAPVEPERILEVVEALAGRLVARILDPAMRLQERGGTEKALGVPPVARTRGRAAGAQDALVEAVELLAVLVALLPFLLGRARDGLQPRLDRRVLRVERGEVGHQIL